MASHAGIPGDVRLVRRLVFREADVAIRTEDLARTVFLFQRIDQGHHRALDHLFVGLPVGVEVTLRVVQLEPDEKALVLLRPAAERGCHGVAIGYRAFEFAKMSGWIPTRSRHVDSGAPSKRATGPWRRSPGST